MDTVGFVVSPPGVGDGAGAGAGAGVDGSSATICTGGAEGSEPLQAVRARTSNTLDNRQNDAGAITDPVRIDKLSDEIIAE
jgi:hypothetical protein